MNNFFEYLSFFKLQFRNVLFEFDSPGTGRRMMFGKYSEMGEVGKKKAWEHLLCSNCQLLALTTVYI